MDSKSASVPRLPKHIALVMDGNGRWAKKRFLPRTAGHRAGIKRVRELIEQCAQKGVGVLTLFTFSSENWRRPAEEVSILMSLMLECFKKETKSLHENNVQVKIIGDKAGLNQDLQNWMQETESLTCDNTGLKLRLAINYGGAWDICQAVKACVQEVQVGTLMPEAIDEAAIQVHLSTADVPNPDLFIRTSGEQRISNFMQWQLAYAELYFTSTLFPDFSPLEFEKALTWFAARERRFGKISEQVSLEG